MTSFVLGEFRRALDDRYRVSLPPELMGSLPDEQRAKCVLAKERPGALSLWRSAEWKDRLDKDVELIRAKAEAGHLRNRIADIQLLGRLLSARHRDIQIAGRGRLGIPEGFRDYLGVEPGGEVVIVGAAVCVELWRPDSWIAHLNDHIPHFSDLVKGLAE